jgi:hypothetical protein
VTKLYSHNQLIFMLNSYLIVFKTAQGLTANPCSFNDAEAGITCKRSGGAWCSVGKCRNGLPLAHTACILIFN